MTRFLKQLVRNVMCFHESKTGLWEKGSNQSLSQTAHISNTIFKFYDNLQETLFRKYDSHLIQFASAV